MEKLLFEQANEIVRELTENSKFIPQENKTGITFMAGKQRLVKIVKTQKNLKLEINIELSKKLENLENLEKISKATAHEKHLGTMKYLYKSNNLDNLNNIIIDLLKNYEKSKNSK